MEETITTSPAGELISYDWKKWLTNTTTFLQPVALLYLGFVSNNLQDGFDWFDFIPNAFLAGSVTLYIVNCLTDLLNKFKGEGKYIDGHTV